MCMCGCRNLYYRYSSIILYGFMGRFQQGDIVILLNYNFNLHDRNNIIRMQSLTYNQLSSQRFQDVFNYGWYKSG